MKKLKPNWAIRSWLGRGATVSPELRNTITLQFYTELYASSPFCFFFFAAFSCRAEGLNTEAILRIPPRYRYVQMNTTAKLKKM